MLTPNPSYQNKRVASGKGVKKASSSSTNFKKTVENLRRAYQKLKNQLENRTDKLLKANSILKKQSVERKRMEKALKKSQEDLERQVGERTIELRREMTERERSMGKWRAIFENVEEGIFILDKSMNIVQLNQAAELASGHSQADIIGKKYYEIFRCYDAVGNYFPDFCPVEKVCITKEPIPYDEHLHTTLNGKKLWVGVSYTPILSKEGEIEQIVGVVRDITALKEIERAKSEFVSIASHELRTPLTVINGYLSLLLSGDIGDLSSSPARTREMLVLTKVFRETKRLIKLVADLLNVSRIEEGRLKLNLKRVEFERIIEEVVNEYKPQAEARDINILVNLKASNRNENSRVLVDEDRIKQVLVNLIDNALKFTKPGGKIIVKCVQENGKITTEISDTGIGISKDLMPKIFEKFQQEPGSYLKENKGTGLGLFIVKSILELHNGTVQVKSTPGRGTTLTFSLPTVA